MNTPDNLADGRAYVGEVVAVLDETAPAMGPGIYYVLGGAVLLKPLAIRRSVEELFADTPDRTKEFHWNREGPRARARMIKLIIDHEIFAVSKYQSVARKGQALARQRLLVAMADDLRHEMQIDHLIIESGDHSTDQRDKATLQDSFRDRGGVPFAYDWRSKKEPILWIADAINGVIHDYFAKDDRVFLDQLLEAGVLSNEPEYLA